MAFTDIDILARTIQCEAGGEGDNGMKAVACVIMNRVQVQYGEYSNYRTIREVVFQNGQFNRASEVLGGEYNAQKIYDMRPEQQHYDIASWAIAGQRLPNLGFALWFFKPFAATCRTFLLTSVGEFVIRIGKHCFYNPTEAYAET